MNASKGHIALPSYLSVVAGQDSATVLTVVREQLQFRQQYHGGTVSLPLSVCGLLSFRLLDV